MQISGNDKLDAVIKASYLRLHQQGVFVGKTYLRYLDLFERYVTPLAGRRVLDYGCGPCGGLANELGEQVIPYDPYVSEFQDDPWDKSFQVVFSSDVLEHLYVAQIHEFLQKVKAKNPEHVFLSVSLRAANKTLDNGVNVHLTVEPAAWWLGTLQVYFRATHTPVLALEDLLEGTGIFCLRRNDLRDFRGASKIQESATHSEALRSA